MATIQCTIHRPYGDATVGLARPVTLAEALLNLLGDAPMVEDFWQCAGGLAVQLKRSFVSETDRLITYGGTPDELRLLTQVLDQAQDYRHGYGRNDLVDAMITTDGIPVVNLSGDDFVVLARRFPVAPWAPMALLYALGLPRDYATICEYADPSRLRALIDWALAQSRRPALVAA